eukprot:677001-Hanusia_phi.AAC.1
MGKRVNVVKKVFEEFSGCTDLKVVIACRSDYLQGGEGSEALFLQPKSRGVALETVWVCPLEMSNKALVDRYIDHYVSEYEHGWDKEDYERALASIPELGEIIRTPFVLKVTLSALPGLFDRRAKHSDLKVTRHNLYKEYAKQWSDREWDKADSRSEIMQKLAALGLDDENYRVHYLEASKLLAKEMLLENQNHLTCTGGNGVFGREPFSMRGTSRFVEEGGYWLIRGCPTHLHLTRKKTSESLHFSFIHDTLRSFFLSEETYEQVTDEDGGDQPPEGLSLGLMTESREDVREHVDLVLQDAVYKEKLFDLVRASRTSTDTKTLTAAANAATILVAAREAFSGLDMRSIKIPGASLRNGIFHRTDFTEADLSGVDGSHGLFSETLLEGAKLEEMIFREYP